ncbi:MAG: hypothetical protein K2M17_05300, partial [Bacilli bacterium]|nr:hypothetical protein [Bacilli bacterium]
MMLEEEILEEIDKKEEETSNEIVEIDENSNTTIYDLKEIQLENNNNSNNKKTEKKKKEKNKKKFKWSDLEKKQKIIIIVSVVVVLLLLVGLLLYFFVFKKDEKVEEKKPEEPIVIVEKDNYRYENGKLIFVDKSKKDLGSYECENKDEELCYVAYYSDEDNFDIDRHVYEDGTTIENRSDIMNDRYAFVYDNAKKENGSIKLYDFEEEKEVGTYKLVKEVTSDKVIVQDEKEKYGIIAFAENGTEKMVDFKYDYLGYILSSKNIVAKNNLNYTLLDMEGKEVTKNIPGEIKNFNDKYLSVLVDKTYYIYDYKGVKANNTAYDYIAFKDSYVIGAESKKLFIFDQSMNPLNLDGIKISSSNYNTTITFDENKKQIKKDEAFKISTTRDKLTITFDEEEKVINVHEGRLSSKEEYINYFDNTLYFYSDKEKTNLLGSYTCKNPNVLDASSTSLNNCYIAKEKLLLNRNLETKAENLGYIPIYNSRYVFIQDNSTANSDDNIILWDLKQNKQQANYAEVDAGYYQKDGVINFIDTANTLIMAKNK